MALDSTNIIILANQNNADSIAFAQYYADQYKIDYGNIIGLDCSEEEILPSYLEFQTQIEDSVLQALQTEYGQIKTILIGYGVPGGFQDGSSYIATGSRLSRIFWLYSEHTPNPIFNRSTFKEYDYLDSLDALICARIDAPTLEDAKNIVKNGQRARKQNIVNGKFYFDKNNILASSQDDSYFNELVEFEQLSLPNLNLHTKQTVKWDDDTDVPLVNIRDDSFVWAWHWSRIGLNYFKETGNLRVFCYNADLDGGRTLRSIEARRWPIMALLNGYSNSAGNLGATGSQYSLRPRPFFDALFRGYTVGEAYIFSVPYLDSSIELFGDPLVKVRFASPANISTSLDELKTFQLLVGNVEAILAYSDKISQQGGDINNAIFTSQDVTFKGSLFSNGSNYAGNLQSIESSRYNGIINGLRSLPNRDINTYLGNREIKVSSTLAAKFTGINSVNVSSANKVLVDYSLLKTGFAFQKYQLEAQVSQDDTFATTLYTSNSVDNNEDWQFEIDQNYFSNFPAEGVGSNLAGRRARFQTTLLNRAQVVFIRVRQLDSFNDPSEWTTLKTVVI